MGLQALLWYLQGSVVLRCCSGFPVPVVAAGSPLEGGALFIVNIHEGSFHVLGNMVFVEFEFSLVDRLYITA